VGHVNLLQVSHLDQVVGKGLNLSVGQGALNEMQTLDGGHLEQISQNCAGELIVIAIKLLNLSLLNLIDESLSTCVVNVVVLELQFLEGSGLFHKATDLLGTD